MESLADQRISDGMMTARQYDMVRAGIAAEITKARAIGDHRKTVILCCRFVDAFPRSGLAPIDKAVRKAFQKIRDDARRELKSICPVCHGVMYDQTCPDDMARPYCAHCGRTYTPMGYMDDDDYARKWHAILWDGGSEPSEIIEVR
jgi:hypothetical protein